MEERRITMANIIIGRLNGVMRRVIFFSRKILIDQRRRRKSVPKAIRICFGRMKRSVVLARKNEGTRKKRMAVEMIEMFLR